MNPGETEEEFTPVQKAMMDKMCDLADRYGAQANGQSPSSNAIRALLREDMAKLMICFANFTVMSWNGVTEEIPGEKRK